jgi:hypothetical protein
MDSHRESGLTIKAFCEEQGISQVTFSSWKKRLSSLPLESGESGFIALHPTGQRTYKGLGIRIRVGTELEVELPGTYPLEDLSKLIRSLSC